MPPTEKTHLRTFAKPVHDRFCFFKHFPNSSQGSLHENSNQQNVHTHKDTTFMGTSVTFSQSILQFDDSL